MYTLFLVVHNFFRWVVLVMAILSLVRAYLGWFGNLDWSGGDRRVGMFFSVAMDIQLLLGLILYIFLSPLIRTVFQDLGAAMQDAVTRFFVLEHLVYMLAAVALVHVGNSRAKKVVEATAKFRIVAVFHSLAVLLILIAIPWSRPLLRGF